MKKQLAKNIAPGLRLYFSDEAECPRCKVGIGRHQRHSYWLYDGKANVGMFIFYANPPKNCKRLYVLELWGSRAQQLRAEKARYLGETENEDDVSEYQELDVKAVTPLLESMGLELPMLIQHLRPPKV